MAELPDDPELTPTRYDELSSHDPVVLFDVLGSGVVAHVALVRDGEPIVLGTAYGFDDDFLYLHGSTGSRLSRDMADGRPLCISIATLDGFLFARTGFDSAVSYRSAVIRGSATECVDDEKVRALRLINENLMPGRWDELPAPTRKELAATLVLRVPLDRVSVKVLPHHDPEDDFDDGSGADALDPRLWVGSLRVGLAAGEPVASRGMSGEVPVPESVKRQMTRFVLPE